QRTRRRGKAAEGSLHCGAQKARASGRDDGFWQDATKAPALQNQPGRKEGASAVRFAQGKKAAATRARGREVATLERKSPPFAEKREGWGTLKYVVKHRCQDNPRNERQDSKTRPALEVAAHSDVKAAASRRTPKPPCLGDCADM